MELSEENKILFPLKVSSQYLYVGFSLEILGA